MSETTSSSPQQVTHDKVFYLWFPIDKLNFSPDVISEITPLYNGTKDQLYPLAELLIAGLTHPTSLPFFNILINYQDPIIQRFIHVPGGMGALTYEEALHVFSVFFLGINQGVKASVQLAMTVRKLYLSYIWDSALAISVLGMTRPKVFLSYPEIYARLNYPEIPPSWLTYDSVNSVIKAKQGEIDYLVIGSGPAGATVAHELQKAGKKVVLIEQGPFVVWGSMDTMSYSDLMYQKDTATTQTGGIIIRSGQAMGGGSTVNIDLAFSPLEATVLSRIESWVNDGLIDGSVYSVENISKAYEWVRETIGTRYVAPTELNRNNEVLRDGASAYGVDPSRYHLNRFEQLLSPSPVTQKRDAARELILPAMTDQNNPLSVIPNVAVDELVFSSQGGITEVVGVKMTTTAPWKGRGNTIIDPCKLNIPNGTPVSINAKNVILCAGTIGSTHILLNTLYGTTGASPVNNPNIGKGLILHPSFPIIGIFDETINLSEGLDSATYVSSFGITPGIILETMAGAPAYGALLIPGSGTDVYQNLKEFNNAAGFGVMLIDTPSDNNRVLDADTGIAYSLSEGDKDRFRTGIGIALKMMFDAGAKKVIIPTNENVLEDANFDPMKGVYLHNPDQIEKVTKNLQFIDNRTILTAAHLQASNKIGKSAASSVASKNQRIWNSISNQEIPNLYLMDSSMFPTSVGANPMQALYTFAKIFADRLIAGID